MNQPTIGHRRRFTPEQKQEAIDLCLDERYSYSYVLRFTTFVSRQSRRCSYLLFQI